MTKITYDKAKITDIDDVMHIEETSFPADEVLARASMLERIQVIPERFFVARNEEGRVVGILVGPTSDKCYLTDDMFEKTEASLPTDRFQIIVSLAVDSEYQGLGIATSLLDLMKEAAAEESRQGISLTCVENLIPYYERYGFVSKGISDSQLAGETWYNMVLPL